MRFYRNLLITVFFCLTIGAKAQITESRWEIISSRNFDLYLPKSSDLDYYKLLGDAEKHLSYCENLFDFHINESIRLVLSKNENIVKIPVSNNNSKSTEVEFDRHTGYIVSNTDYNEILLKVKNAIVLILFNDLMYGKTFQDRIQINAVLQIQNWYVKGLIAYCNEPWSDKYDGLLREYFQSHKNPGFNVLAEQDETLAGYSFWKYIMEQYGEQNMANTLYISNLTRSMEGGLFFVYGKDLPELMREWQTYYKVIYGDEFKNNGEENEMELPFAENLEKVCISPDGKWLAGIRHEAFKTKIYCLNLKTKNRILINTSEGNNEVILRWRETGKSNELLYNISTTASENIVFYNPAKRRNTKHLDVKDFDRLLNFDIDAKGNYIFYGVKRSKTYLVFYEGKSQALKTLLSGVVLSDVKLFEGKPYLSEVIGNTSFLMKYDNQLDTLLKLNSSGFKLLSIDSAAILLQTSFKGVNQLFSFSTIQRSLKSLTAFTHNAASISSSPVSNSCYFTIGKVVTSKTRQVTFHEYDTTDLPVSFYYANPKGKVLNIIKTITQADSNTVLDTVKEVNSKYYFVNGFNEETENEYRHLLDSIKQAQLENKINLSYLKSYELNFATLKVSMFQFDNSPYFNMLDLAPLNPNGIQNFYYYHYMKSEIALKDILNKYQLFGGLRLSTNLGGGYDAFVRFEKTYKLYTLQSGVYYFQKRNINVGQNNIMKHQVQQAFFNYGFKYSNTINLKIGGNIMTYANTVLSTERNGLSMGNKGAVISSVTGEFQYYCLKKFSDFLYRGVSLQVQPFAYYNSSTNHLNSAFKINFKYYKPLYRRIVWSNQIVVNASQGLDKVVNILGGAENWILVKYNEQNQLLGAYNYQLRMYGGAIRGFNQNVRNGNNSFCINSELRIPLAGLLSKWPTDKQWYSKLLLIPFADLGSAWNGLNLFNNANNYTIRYFDFNSSYKKTTAVEVKSQRNPLVGSIGAGLNTRIIGYNVRLDIAFGIEDGILHKPMYLLSYGTNF